MSASILPPTTGRVRGPIRRVATLTTLLARPSRQGRAAIVLPVVAFAVTTALLLVVTGGTRMFLTAPQAQGEFEMFYAILSMLALLLITVPLATLGAAAARLSSRRRNDRLATLRLLGATSGEVGAITVIEASATAFVGAVIGVGLYGAFLPLVGLLPFFGAPIGTASAWAGWPLVGIACLALTLLATVSAAASLRRVRLTPLGVRRRTDAPSRRFRSLVIGAVALAFLTLIVLNASAIGQLLGPIVFIGALLGAFAGALALLNLIGTPLLAARGRRLARRAPDAARLIAGRELAAHAGAAWRRVSGIAMISFIAVVGGAGMSLATLADDGDAAISILFADIRTGVLVTLGAAFVLVACSVGVTQAASVLEDRDLIVGLDKLGVPAHELQRARRLAVMVPLRWAALGGALIGGGLSLPLIGATVLFAPAALAVIAATFVAGLLLVQLAVAAATPLVTAIRRNSTG
ncbi:FtsX-like permease family protein [Microbacterium halotolerans]|uniref:FtsX-like permease family protein n=1 Tax=Microbacterium halotolerans TaxID=246613 RepID=UPI000E6AC5CE|nr:FtsX-like permease family protein [Microbacterium halotolerans]